ncbi:MAG: class I SAM-dependent methyltransferase [Methylophilus sp.]
MQVNTQDDWLKSPLGCYLLAKEKAIYDANVVNIFGFNAMQIGMLEMDLLQQSRIPKLIRVGEHSGDVCCACEYLPFDASTIDLVCMPHVLEFSQNPHQTLREVERVLVPEGYVILTGFNPVSIWAIRRWISRAKQYPWSGKNFSIGRIKDWLALLGLEYVTSSTEAFIFPINDQKWINRQKQLENMTGKCCPPLGGIYYIVARKRVVNMTLLKPSWKSNMIKSGLAVPQPKKKPVKNKELIE